MEYTSNYHLPQWVESDRIMMGDFNEAMASIESGLSTAQGSADAAQSTADTAYCPTNKPYTVGHYTGSNTETTITLGFRPSFVIISGSSTASPTGMESLGSRDIFTGGNVLSECISFTDTGFVLHVLDGNVYPQLVKLGISYDYIAFQ